VPLTFHHRQFHGRYQVPSPGLLLSIKPLTTPGCLPLTAAGTRRSRSSPAIIHPQVCISLLLETLVTTQYPTLQTLYREQLRGGNLCHHTERFYRAGGKWPAVDTADLCPARAFKVGISALPSISSSLWCVMPLSFPHASMEFVDVAGDERSSQRSVSHLTAF